MKVLKFGWTSLKNLEMILRTTDIVLEAKKEEKVLVVVSAMSQVTNKLIDLCNFAELWEVDKVSKWLELLQEKHYEVVKWLYPENYKEIWKKYMNDTIEELVYIIKWVSFLKSKLSDKNKAKILYFWEILSSILVSLSIKSKNIKSRSLLSKDLLMCSWHYTDWDCDKKLSKKTIKDQLWKIDLNLEIPIITWFWWWDSDWDIYLFDRWWSDYVATLVARLVKASSVEIRTDVSWVMSADPRIVEKPIIWKELNYTVAAEFALVWAKVLHPKTISPVKKLWIPVFIKNTFAPKDYGTKISNIKDKWIKGINIDDKQVILTFLDPSMLWSFGYIYEVAKVFYENKVSIDTVATTETSFSITIRKKYFSDEFLAKFMHLKQYLELNVEKDILKVTLVWDTIDNYKVFNSLENIVMVSQWEFQKSLTIFVKKVDSDELLKKLHKDVFGV